MNARADEHNDRTSGTALVRLEARAERLMIRPVGSQRHVDFEIRVAEAPAAQAPERAPLNLALVIDRSGSMAGEKLATAKRAAISVLERLEERDRVALVVFDDRINTLQSAAPATAALKAQVQRALEGVQARANTALHEGWLTGCQAIAADEGDRVPGAVSRCFLLTDGLANVGITDPEQIAGEAAGIREHAGIGTSTFGIGADYDERLLAPLAVAGGGQFHHLRTAQEIANTFVGELGGMLAVAASQVRLEVEADPGVTADVVSQYWVRPGLDQQSRWTIGLGDLIGGEERHVVVRFHFPSQGSRSEQPLRARLVWSARGEEQTGEWRELRFRYASHAECDAERRDLKVMHWVGLHHAVRAQRDASERSRHGDLHGAREALQSVAKHISTYAGADADLQAALEELKAFEPLVASAPAAPLVIKEAFYQSHRRSRSQKDYRA